MKQLTRLNQVAVATGIVLVTALVLTTIVLMWRGGLFDEPSSTEKWARIERRNQRAEAFSVTIQIIMYAGALVLVGSGVCLLRFLNAKAANAGTMLYARNGLFPVVRIRTHGGDLGFLDPNRLLAPYARVGAVDGDAVFTGAADMQLPVTLGALTVQRQVAAMSGDKLGSGVLIDEDPAVPDIVAHGQLPEVELDTDNHIQSLLEQAGLEGSGGHD